MAFAATMRHGPYPDTEGRMIWQGLKMVTWHSDQRPAACMPSVGRKAMPKRYLKSGAPDGYCCTNQKRYYGNAFNLRMFSLLWARNLRNSFPSCTNLLRSLLSQSAPLTILKMIRGRK